MFIFCLLIFVVMLLFFGGMFLPSLLVCLFDCCFVCFHRLPQKKANTICWSFSLAMSSTILAGLATPKQLVFLILR